MESSIAVFLTRRTACELPPTRGAMTQGVGTEARQEKELGLRDRTSPSCTLSQNGYGGYGVPTRRQGTLARPLCGGGVCGDVSCVFVAWSGCEVCGVVARSGGMAACRACTAGHTEALWRMVSGQCARTVA